MHVLCNRTFKADGVANKSPAYQQLGNSQTSCLHLLFSSTSAILGLARASAYALSSAYLDILPFARLLQACSGTRIVWGAVASVGFAS